MKPHKKKVLLVHNYYQIGGGEHTVFENEKKLLQNKEHEVFEYTRSNDELKCSGWKMLLLPISMLWSFKTFFEVRKIIRANGIEVVHCHNTFPLISPSVYYAARSMKVPVVQTVHNFRFLCPNGLFYCNGKICEKCKENRSFVAAVKNRCYRDSRLQTLAVVLMLTVHRWLGTYRKINYIFLTEFNRQKFGSLIDTQAQNVFVKSNFVFPYERGKRNPAHSTAFVYAGRVDENKGILFLLDVWKELPQEYELHIYGDGACWKECETAATAYNNIHFHGFQTRETVSAQLADSAALIFSSVLHEGYPMTVAESFAAGIPVLAADCGNHGAIIRESQGGTVYEVGDKMSFLAALDDILNNNDRYAQNAKAYYQQYLSEQNNYDRLIEIYDNAKHIQ